MTQFAKNDVIIAFERDRDVFGPVNDMNNWYVTKEWANIFNKHLELLLPFSEKGDVASQYAVAIIYMCNYLYTSEDEALILYERDSKIYTKWLVEAAKAGHVGAIDNILVMGVGEEAERLRNVANNNKDKFKPAPTPSVGWEENMKLLHKLAYGS